MLSRDVFSTCLDINVYFTIHLIKEIKLLGHVFLHQMYAYERFNAILKSFVRNRAYPEGSMVQGYCTEEVVEWALNYADPSNPIGVPMSRHEGKLIEKMDHWKEGYNSKSTFIPLRSFPCVATDVHCV
jgi:hypothetical protein